MTKTKKFLRLEFIFSLVCAILTIASIVFSAVCFENAKYFYGINALICSMALGANTFVLLTCWNKKLVKQEIQEKQRELDEFENAWKTEMRKEQEKWN